MFTNPLLTPFIAQPPDPEILALIPTLPTFVNTTPVPLNQVGATFDARTQNQASTRLRGLDFFLGRSFELGAGAFDLGLNGSYLFEFTNQQVANVPGVDVVDTIFNPVAFRARGSVAWRSDRLSLAAFVNYTDSYRDNQIPTDQVGVSSWTTLDLSASYDFGDLKLRASVNNVFDGAPPTIIDRVPSYGNPGYDTENANPLGRLVVLELVKSW
jgi:iron complex outermembrane receptor protein